MATITEQPGRAEPDRGAEPGGGASGGGVPHVGIGILGAGFAGLGMAIRLKQAGIDDYLVCDRDTDIGGTWSANTYPGCQCDIPSHLYSFSFAPNPEWTRTYPKQPELRAYLNDCADRFGVRDRIRLGCEVTSAAWDEDAGLWRVETSQGAFTADIVVAAPGALSEPRYPDIPGFDDFEGAIFHTARWNADHDLRGERVAVVGTGASAIQAVPNIAPIVEHLDVYQRTPPWVVPHRDRPITEPERRLYRRVPLAQRIARAFVYGARELLVPALAYRPGLMKIVDRVARQHIRSQVPDPELRRKVTPGYTIGCKRILPSNEWYPALARENVDLVCDGIAEIKPGAIVTAAGEERAVDTIIFATGFSVTDMPIAHTTRGVGGVTLDEAWAGSPQSYLGSTVAGFPNLFFLVGPNTGLGHNSMVYMIESQIAYVLDAVRQLRSRGATRVEVRRDVQDAYNDELQERLERTVWNTGGCASWYLDANGRNSTLWPDFTFRFRQRTRRFDAESYEIVSAPERAARPVAGAAPSAAA